MAEYIDSELQMQSKLILFIENPEDKIKMFVGWSETEHYYVRGNDETKNVPFAFYIDTFKSCLHFIQLFFINSSYMYITVYNYNNMMYWNVDDLTYDFFESYRDEQYEILKYLKNDDDIIKVLKMLKHSYNYEKQDEDEQQKEN